MSISVSTPNPWSANAFRVRATASSKEACRVVDNDHAMLIDLVFLSDPRGVVALSLVACGHIQFGVHASAVVASDVADQFVASRRQSDGGPPGRLRRDAVVA